MRLPGHAPSCHGTVPVGVERHQHERGWNQEGVDRLVRGSGVLCGLNVRGGRGVPSVGQVADSRALFIAVWKEGDFVVRQAGHPVFGEGGNVRSFWGNTWKERRN